ncbi:MAG: hypothetical protein WCN98_00315 [Verrucomicrobiaceae bacterium]
MAHPPRIPVLLAPEKVVAYFITFCVQDRLLALANAEAFAAFKVAANRLEGKWFIHSAVLMPDHLHFIAFPFQRDASISNLSAALKRWMRQSLKAKWKWQHGCFDRLLRNGESADAKWEYIRENPVRAGLVKHWNDWPYQFGVDPDDRPDPPFQMDI